MVHAGHRNDPYGNIKDGGHGDSAAFHIRMLNKTAAFRPPFPFFHRKGLAPVILGNAQLQQVHGPFQVLAVEHIGKADLGLAQGWI